MRKLVTLALATMVVSQLAGCIIIADDEEGGYFDVTWSLEMYGAGVSCSDVGAATVELIATHDGTTNFETASWDCNLGGGVTPQFPLDTYQIVVNILDNVGTKMNADLVPVTYTIDVDQETVELPNFNYDFSAYYNILFTLDLGTAGGTPNIDTAAQQGVNLYEGSTCVPAPIFAGTTDLGDTCGTPQVMQENNIVQQIVDIAPGTYGFEVLGYKGAMNGEIQLCYSNSETAIPSITVGTADLNLGNVLAPFMLDPPDTICEDNPSAPTGPGCGATICNSTKPYYTP